MYKKLSTTIAIAAMAFYANAALASSLLLPNLSNQEYVTWANQQWITKYSEEWSFRWNDKITREQAAKMLYTWLSRHTDLTSNMPKWICVKFHDDATIDASLHEAVYEACGMGLIKWYKGNMMPNGYISASDMKVFLSRASTIMPQLKDYIDSVTLNDWYYLTRMDMVKWLYIVEGWVQWQKFAAEQNKLDEAKGLWTKSAIPTYTLIQKVDCYCSPESTRSVKYNVVNGVVDMTGAYYADTSGGVLTGVANLSLNTVEQAFAKIQEAIDSKADSIEVQYDTLLWYPTSISIDRSKMMADEELSYTYELTK